MKWVHAKERLPDVLPDRSEQFFVKDMRYAGIHGFSKKTCFYGITNGSLLRQYPDDMYWLDESEPPLGEGDKEQDTGFEEWLRVHRKVLHDFYTEKFTIQRKQK